MKARIHFDDSDLERFAGRTVAVVSYDDVENLLIIAFTDSTCMIISTRLFVEGGLNE